MTFFYNSVLASDDEIQDIVLASDDGNTGI